jgi:hypothetical protein
VTAVRYQRISHDFVMVNALRDAHAVKAATARGGDILREAEPNPVRERDGPDPHGPLE